MHAPSSDSSASRTWRFEPRKTSRGVEYDVFDGVEVEPICTLRSEANARRFVKSANETGYPDLAIYADDEKGL